MKQHENIKETVRYFFLLPFVFALSALPLQAQPLKAYTDSLERVLQTQSLSNDKLYEIYEKIIYENLDENPTKSLEYSWKGIRFAKKIKNDFYLAKFYYYAGNLHNYDNKIDSALYYHDLSLEMQKQARKKGLDYGNEINWLEMRLFQLLGDVNYSKGGYDLSLDNFFKALHIAEEKIDDPEEEGEICCRIGDVYWAMRNYSKAEDYYLKYEKISREHNDPIGITCAYNQLSDIYTNYNDYPKALEYAEEAYRILISLPDVPLRFMINTTGRLSDAWLVIPDYDKALKFAKISLEYSIQNNVSHRIASSMCNVSKCYLKLKQWKKAEETAFQALETDTSIEYVNSLLYQVIAISNIWLKNSEKAYIYFGKSIEAIHEYSNENFQASISEMEVLYETEKKEMQIATLEAEKRLMIWLSIAGGVVLLLGLAAFFLLWQWTMQKRRLAESYIKQLEQEKQIIATQSVLDGEVQERTRLARDLHDGMGGKLTILKIHLERLKQIVGFNREQEEQYNVVADILNDSVREMRRVSHNLMPETLSRAGLKPAVDEFCRTMTPQVVFSYFGNESRLDLKLEVLAYRSIYELVNNALKYAGASQIMVQIVHDTNNVSFTVQDDGCGFDPTAATEGMGLQSIRTRVASFGGDIQIDSKAGVGTEVNVELRIEN
ncbi:MAG: sensor histidine kinase [Lentimicrobiaceae bacterium]|nr:sensor histidine kinase [Lentimicrobiaceae bacterium]